MLQLVVSIHVCSQNHSRQVDVQEVNRGVLTWTPMALDRFSTTCFKLDFSSGPLGRPCVPHQYYCRVLTVGNLELDIRMEVRWCLQIALHDTELVLLRQ